MPVFYDNFLFANRLSNRQMILPSRLTSLDVRKMREHGVLAFGASAIDLRLRQAFNTIWIYGKSATSPLPWRWQDVPGEVRNDDRVFPNLKNQDWTVRYGGSIFRFLDICCLVSTHIAFSELDDLLSHSFLTRELIWPSLVIVDYLFFVPHELRWNLHIAFAH
jgi:hypothetical protein